MNKHLFLVLATGVFAACGTAPTPPGAGGPVGALAFTAELDGTDASTGAVIDRVTYTISAPDLAAPITGELAVVDSVASAQLTVPVGDQRTLEVTYRANGVACTAAARDLSIEAGRTAQVLVVPYCGTGSIAHANKAPRIEAVYASRRSVQVGEQVALAVVATDDNGDPLSYRWTENVPGFGFGASRKLSTTWKAGPRAVAHNKLTITVTDGRGGAASRSITMDFDGLALGAGTCATPTPIAIGERVRGFTVGAGSVNGSIGCNIPADAAPEHVFKLEVPTRQDVSVSVTGSAFFARVYVRKDACAAGTEVGCDQFSQRIDLPQAEPGTYYVFVDGDSPFAQGEFQLTVFSGIQPEECRNFNDDDGDGAVDCADSDCADAPGCLECAFNCDPDPDDCIGGECDRFSGRCNTFPRFGQACDRDNNPATADICDQNAQCVVNTAVCGNGVVELNEQCDDGNVVDGDGCTATCQVVGICGNGIPEFPEECDDGNLIAGDGCDSTCRVERCGPITCDDGNPCTVDVCTDPVAGICSTTPLADGTTCDRDGSPATPETCQAGQCVAPPPDAALLVLDPAVLADPAFSLAAMHARLSPTGDAAGQFQEWADTLTATQTINGRTVAARSGFTTFLAGVPRNGTAIDVDAAGFLPAAMVNRFDLRQPGNCGENRLVFTKTTGVTNPGDRMTLIFEFNVPDDGSHCAHALARWTALRGLSGDALRTAAAALVADFARPDQLNHFRTNEFVNAPVWELREFRLVGGHLLPNPVVDTVPFALAQDPVFRQFVIENAAALNRGAREIGMIPFAFLAPMGTSSGEIVAIGNLVPSIPGLEANLNILTCSGCHLTQTGTAFVHIAERDLATASPLSTFMRSELEFRRGDLEAFLAQP
ncbi:MAG: DUF4215 domain-containing protein [Deltaproteobacteria bacterium]|nr:DUF4215 domain-containing protein [Deltaproteobacteria bacterium]